MGSISLYDWWIQHTTPTHPVIDDSRHELFQQIGIHNSWPAVYVVDCHGAVKLAKQGNLNEQGYAQVKAAIELALGDKTCFPTKP